MIQLLFRIIGAMVLLVPVAASQTLSVSETTLNFGVRPNNVTATPTQTVTVTAPPGSLWSARPSSTNIRVLLPPTGGSGPLGVYAVGQGNSGTVTIALAGYPSVTITVNINNLNGVDTTSSNPSNTVGFIDQPAASQSTGFAGAIPFTGWVVDDIGIRSVSVYREPVAQDPGNAIIYVLGKSLVYIGDAIFLPDTRPDVAGAYPVAPYNFKAGWGMLVLSNTLPNNNGTTGAGGNGTYTFHIISKSIEGFLFEIGTRTITIDNTHSPLPFGTIDTPAQGETVTLNTQYTNFAWALTAQPNIIPADGSTMFVSIDGANAGRPNYGYSRADINSLFPGYQNSGHAVGYFYIDTTALHSGIHGIAWSVRDSGGNLQGIGSRVFYVNNPALPSPDPGALPPALGPAWVPHLMVRRGPDFEGPALRHPSRLITTKPGERVEVHTSHPLADVSQQILPACSSVNDDAFFWQVPIMALGDFPVTLRTAAGETVDLLFRVQLNDNRE